MDETTPMQNEETFLYFKIGESSYLISILDTQEVAEPPPIKPYPVPYPGHLGITNLHGQIVPVISMEQYGTARSPNRLIVLRKQDTLFGFLCGAVKKVILPFEKYPRLQPSEVVDLEGGPAKLVTANALGRLEG